MARHYVCSILLHLLFGASSQPAFLSLAQDKSPMPPAEAQAKALALVKEVYGQEWDAAKTSKERQSLANKLFQKATETTDATDCYVLLDVARQIAAQAGDAELAFKAIEAMSRRYDVDAYRLKGAALAQAAKEASSAQSVATAKLCLGMMDEAVERDDLVAAKYLGNIAVDAARKGRDTTLAKDIVARNREVEEIGQAFAQIQDGVGMLKSNPVDPDANLTVGRYYCFFKGNWDRGLPMMALGSDLKLKELAVKELKSVPDTAGQVALGDGWWDVAAASEGVAQKQLEGRAVYWYRKALPALSGLVKDKVEKRLPEDGGERVTAKVAQPGRHSVGKGKKPDAVTSYRFADEATIKEQWTIKGKWRMEGGGIRLYAPDASIRLRQDVEGDFVLRFPFNLSGHFCGVSVNTLGESLDYGEKKGAHTATVARKGDILYFAIDTESPRSVRIKSENNRPNAQVSIHLNSRYAMSELLVREVGIVVDR